MALLMCYGWEGFRRELENNGWKDGNLPKDWIFISIGEYEPWWKEPHVLKECDQVINLNFDDICGYRMWDALPNEEWTEEKKMLFSKEHGMSDEDAKRLFEFLDKNIGKNVMVHCSAGISRSQGVVRYLLDMYHEHYKTIDTNPRNPCQLPNGHVVCLLKREYYKKYGFLDNDGNQVKIDQ